jgi:hypothetical protein
MTLEESEMHEALDDLIDRWHEGEGREMKLHEWLGMTREEYGPFASRAVIPAGYRLPVRPAMSIQIHGVRRSFPSRTQP